MQNLIVVKPYEFVPPSHQVWLQSLVLKFLPSYLRRNYGLASHEIRHLDRPGAASAACSTAEASLGDSFEANTGN